MKRALRGLRFFLRTGHRDPVAWMTRLWRAKKKSPPTADGGQEELTIADIQRAMDEVARKLCLAAEEEQGEGT